MVRALAHSETNTEESTRSKRKSEIPEGLPGLTLKCCMCEEMHYERRRPCWSSQFYGLIHDTGRL